MQILSTNFFNSFLIEKRGKDIHITSKGRQLLDLVPEELKSPTLTGEWEQKLEAIAKGKLKKVFISEMKNYTKEIVSEIKSSDKNINMTTFQRSLVQTAVNQC